jgi:type VI secretion system secreted protein VgrG
MDAKLEKGLKQMSKGYFIRKHDKTSCGGFVIEATPGIDMHGKDHALEWDRVTCGADGNTYRITGGIPSMTSEGRRLAGTLHSFSSCPCRARLIPSLFTATYQCDGEPASSASALDVSTALVPVPHPVRSDTNQPTDAAIEEEEEEVELEQLITLRIGMFFDGTGNNRDNSEKVYGCFARNVQLEDVQEDIRRFCAAQGYDGVGGAPDDSRGNDGSNVAKLYDLYLDDAQRALPSDATDAFLRVYVEGIGTSSVKGDSRFSQATGLGAQGVRARVEESPALLLKTLTTFQENNPYKRIERIEFDIFGFSRGAAAARDFANEVLKGAASIVARALPVGTPGLADAFAWRHQTDFSINCIGIFDTVAAIAAPLHGDFSGSNANNPGINIGLAPDAAKKIIHLVAKDERRYNFSLNQAGNADIVLPGVHSDLGGGYRPDITERLLLSKPRNSEISPSAPITSATSYRLAQADLRELQTKYAKYELPLKIRTWHLDFTVSVRGIAEKTRRVYAAVSVEREVHNDLALVYLRIMRELAVRHGVPFQAIPARNKRLALPEALIPINEKLMAYALGTNSTYGLTPLEEALLYQRYVHLSSHWNPVTNGTAERDLVFINRPAYNDRRTVHPNE